MIRINEELCDGCGDCVRICPNDVIQVVDGKARVVGDFCTSCHSCESVCDKGAIEVVE